MRRTDILAGAAALIVAGAARVLLASPAHDAGTPPALERPPGTVAPAGLSAGGPAGSEAPPPAALAPDGPSAPPADRGGDAPPVAGADLRAEIPATWTAGTVRLEDALAFAPLTAERHAALAALLRRPELLALEGELARLLGAGSPARRALARELVGASERTRRSETALTVLAQAGDVSPHPVLEFVDDDALARLVEPFLSWGSTRPFDPASWMALARRAPGTEAWRRLLDAVIGTERPEPLRRGLFEVLVHAVWSLPTSSAERALWTDLEGVLARLPGDIAARWVADLARANPVEPVLGWERRFRR